MLSMPPDPAAEELLEFWHQLHSRRSDWALRAYDRLVDTLSLDVQERLRRKDQPTESYVVIFGKTQVGKTTLLLDLMGVAPQRMASVSKVLRGGREPGRSATATAMEYIRATDERWGLSVNAVTHWFTSDEVITARLGELRKDMEAQRLHATSPCVVHIPSSFFLAQHDTAPRVRILDLPGDNPANAAEQAHVNEMAKVYLPFADLIILVGRGDDLGFLRPDEITLPGFGDWQRMPHKFRVATTFSYSAQSVRDRIRADSDMDAAALRRRLVQEIQRFGNLSEAACDLGLYFPLEFGTSWTTVQEQEPALYSRMAPIIHALRTELLGHIVNSTSLMGRLRNTLSTHHSIRALQEEKLQAATMALRELHVEIDSRSASVTSCDAMIASITQSLDGLKMRIVSPAEAEQLILAAMESPDYPPGATYPDCSVLQAAKNVGDFKDFIDRCRVALRHLHLDPAPGSGSGVGRYWTRVHKCLASPDISTIESHLSTALGDIRAHLDEYWIDTYMRKQSLDRDRLAVLKACEEARRVIIDCQAKAWITAVKEVSAQGHEELRAAQHKRDIFRTDRIKFIRQLRARKKKAEQANAELARIQEVYAQDLARCGALDSLLDEEYLAALSTELDTVLTVDDECQALLLLLSCEELTRQRRDLLNMNSKEGAATYAFAS